MSEKRENHLRGLPSMEGDETLRLSNALVAIVELADRLDLSAKAYTALYECVRSLDEEHAELAWHTVGDMNELLAILGIDTLE